MKNYPAARYWRKSIALASVFAFCSTLSSATVQTWLKLHPANVPSARSSMAMAYDPVSKRVVLFGGFDGSNHLNDTWVYDGSTWHQVSSPSAPPPRAAAGMAYDRIAKKLILFGGFSDGQYFGDTWIWDGASETWSQGTPTAHPDGVTGPMVFTDPKTGHVVMYGGFDGNLYQLNTWRWSGKNWIPLHPATTPSARATAICAYDFNRNIVVMYGGLADVNPINTWTWDGSDWTKQNPVNMPFSTFYTPAAYDPELGEVVAFGGGSFLNLMWGWTGSDWEVVETGQTPIARESSGLAWDYDSRQFVLFGGDVPQGFLNDMYVLARRNQ